MSNITSGASNNVILIGMPGAGKSIVGAALAKKLGYGFLDSDILIEESTGKPLHQILAESGQDGFLEVENGINTSIDVKNRVIATGGSAVYGNEAMAHFANIGDIVYLKLPFKEIATRLGDLEKRGVALGAGQTLEDIYAKRVPLYEKYAQITIDCDHKGVRAIVTEIIKNL